MNKIIAVSALLLLSFSVLFGQSLQPKAPKNRPEVSAALPVLRAVLVVGPLEDITGQTIEKVNKIATVLVSNGVKVQKFYDKNADWDKIKEAAKGANIFVYSGHGSTMGEGGKTGGLCLKTMISSQKLMEDLQLHPNALVLFQSVCRGAGSSAGDEGDIGLKEAMTRVGDYAQPFFKSGAGCYYANNMDDGCSKFLTAFFSGKTVQTCYEESAKTWAQMEPSKKFPRDERMLISVASTNWGGITTRTTYTNGVKKVEKIPTSKQYDIAYVANPGYSIKDLQQ